MDAKGRLLFALLVVTISAGCATSDKPASTSANVGDGISTFGLTLPPGTGGSHETMVFLEFLSSGTISLVMDNGRTTPSDDEAPFAECGGMAWRVGEGPDALGGAALWAESEGHLLFASTPDQGVVVDGVRSLAPETLQGPVRLNGTFDVPVNAGDTLLLRISVGALLKSYAPRFLVESQDATFKVAQEERRPFRCAANLADAKGNALVLGTPGNAPAIGSAAWDLAAQVPRDYVLLTVPDPRFPSECEVSISLDERELKRTAETGTACVLEGTAGPGALRLSVDRIVGFGTSFAYFLWEETRSAPGP